MTVNNIDAKCLAILGHDGQAYKANIDCGGPFTDTSGNPKQRRRYCVLGSLIRATKPCHVPIIPALQQSVISRVRQVW